MKTKNNYSKLRSQKNNLQNRLNIANKTVCLQIDEIERLLNVLDGEQKANQSLVNRVNLEVEEKRVALDKLKEIEKKNKTVTKLSIAFTIAIMTITALVAILIKGL